MNEKQKRIDELERCLFFLAMKDHWDAKDYEQDRVWENELRQLRAEQ